MKAIAKAFAAVCIAALVSTPVLAQRPDVTFTTTGIVDIGDDGLHLFSDPGQTASLSGLPFTLSISVDPDFLDPYLTTDYATVLRQWDAGASYHGSMTLNGRTFSWISKPDAEATLEMRRYRPWISTVNEIVELSTYGSDGGTRMISAANRVSSPWDISFMGSVDPMREHAFPVHMEGLYSLALLSVRDSTVADAETFIRASNLSSAIWQVSPVPEPQQYLLFAAGLAALLVLGYRRRRGSRPLATGAVLLGLGLANPAAAQVLSFTTSGVIEDGGDSVGLFGTQQSLAGQAYTMTLTMDAQYLNAASWSVNHAYLENWDGTATIEGELTVGGQVYTWESALADAQAGMSIPHGGFGNDAYVVTMSTWSGALADTRIYATSLLTSKTQAFVSDVELLGDADFSASLPGITSQSYFQATQLDPVSGATSLTWFRAAPVASAVWEVSPVPEPLHAGMLAAGLGVLAFARRRRA